MMSRSELARASELSALKMVLVGVGGCGNNTVNNVKRYGVRVPTVAVNTDAPTLQRISADIKILIGEGAHKGRGAAGSPELGRQIAEQDMDKILAPLRDKELIMITAGMGGGTGTGAGPTIAEAIKEKFPDKIVIGIVTLPFTSEGPTRIRNAQWGLSRMLDSADMTVVNANDLLKERAGNLPVSQAFREMDKLLVDIIDSIVGLQDIVPQPGLVNIDYSNMEVLVRGSGLGFIGIGRGRSAMEAFRNALAANYSQADIRNAKGAIVYVEGNQSQLVMRELDRIPQMLSSDYNIMSIFWGIKPNWKLYEPKIMLLATGVRSELVDRWLQGGIG